MTTPYFRGDGITLYLGKCEEVDEWLVADVLVTDPPYGMAYSSNSSKYNGPSRPIHGDADTHARDDAIRAWGGPSAKPALVFGTWRAARPYGVKQLIVWDKGESPGMGDLTIPWGPSHEEIYVLGSGFTGKRGPSVIRVPTLAPGDARRPNHPTPKPVPLMERLLLHTVGVIADPFAGSGATLVAAHNLGRTAIGVEMHEPYCEIIARRLDQGVLNFDEMVGA